MAVRNLYLRIYLTVVAVLLVFALVAGALIQRQAEAEYARIESAVEERTVALADLLVRNLAPATASEDEQRDSMHQWSRRLRLPVALDAADGRRITESPDFHFYEDVTAAAQDAPAAVRSGGSNPLRPVLRTVLEDGRVLTVGKVRVRPRSTFDGVTRLFGVGTGPRPDRGPSPGRFDERERHFDGGGGPRQPLDKLPRVPHAHDADGNRLALPARLAADRAASNSPGGWLSGTGLTWWGGETTLALVPLTILFIAIALGSYPVVRRLTRRLEDLQRGVEAFGAGKLSQRVSEAGNDEVAAVAVSFNRAAERIEELVRTNRSLLANASHELRSPLARLKMAVEMMDTADAQRRLALKAEIDRDVRELDALVEEVLLASRLDAQTALTPSPIDLIGMAAEEAARVGAQIVLDAPVASLHLTGDVRLVRRALRNLLENARRYGGEDVELTLRRLPAGGGLAGDRITLEVGDRGPGVPVDQRERIFEPFYRLPGHSERAGGVGLGLSLVRQIAQRHGGSVHCEARAGGGSLFVLALPAPKA